MNTSESLTLLSLIVTTFSPVFLPIFDLPIIGISNPVYQDIDRSKVKTYSFVIENYGTGSAENVKVSISSTPFHLLNVSVNPYLSTYLKQDESSLLPMDKKFFEIVTIPPNLALNVSGFINASGKDVSIHPVVFSNKTVGIMGFEGNNLGGLTIGFLVIAAVLLSITVWFYYYVGKDVNIPTKPEEEILKIDHDLKVTFKT